MKKCDLWGVGDMAWGGGGNDASPKLVEGRWQRPNRALAPQLSVYKALKHGN